MKAGRGLTAELGAGLTILVGVVLLRLALSGLYLRFLREGMLWPLLAAGVMFVGLGGWGLVQAMRPGPRRDRADALPADGEQDAGHGHGAEHGPPRVALLLLLPVLAVFLVSPPSLGAFAADRVTQFSTTFEGDPPALRTGPDGVADLSIADYAGRLRTQRPGLSSPVRLTGFVSLESPTAGAFVLNRFAIACCAADARVASIAALGAERLPAEGAWVTVVGRTDPGRPGEPVVLVQAMNEVDEPAQPYEGG